MRYSEFLPVLRSERCMIILVFLILWVVYGKSWYSDHNVSFIGKELLSQHTVRNEVMTDQLLEQKIFINGATVRELVQIPVNLPG